MSKLCPCGHSAGDHRARGVADPCIKCECHNYGDPYYGAGADKVMSIVHALQKLIDAQSDLQLVIDGMFPPDGRDEVGWTVHNAWFDDRESLNAFLIPPFGTGALPTPELLRDIKERLGADWLGVTVYNDRCAYRVSWHKP